MLCHHLAIEKESQFIGLRSGAISIQPITTAVEFCKSQRVIIEVDKNISNKYNLSIFIFSAISFQVFSFSSAVNSKNQIL